MDTMVKCGEKRQCASESMACRTWACGRHFDSRFKEAGSPPQLDAG